MRVVSLKGKREFELREIPEPKKEDGRLLIDVKKCGICGSDIHYWEMGGPSGLVMGHEFSGVIYDSSYEGFEVGDRVTALPISPCMKCDACLSGNYQYCAETWSNASGLSLTYSGGLGPKMSIRGDMAFKLPDNVSFEEAAMVEPTAVALHAIHLADIKVGDNVLVIGAGIIGLESAMFAKMEGAKFVAVSETNVKRGEGAIKLGVCDKFYNAKSEGLMEEILKDNGSLFDIVIDCSGNGPAVTSALTYVKNGGKVILVGVSMESITIPTVMAVMKEVTMQGAIAYTKDEFKTCLDLIAMRKIDVNKFISKVVGQDKVQSAYEELTSGESDSVKIIVDDNM